MDSCCQPLPPAADHRYRRVLVIALVLNAAMFAIEVTASVISSSSSLLADAVDFAGDASNYALSLWALAIVPAWRARAALVKGFCMGAYGLFVLAVAALHARAGTVPEPATMGVVALLALAVNVGVAALLYRYRNGDADAMAQAMAAGGLGAQAVHKLLKGEEVGDQEFSIREGF